MGQGQNLQPAQEKTEKRLVKDLSILGKLVLHDGVCKERQTLPEELASIALEVLRLRWIRLASSRCRLPVLLEW